MLTHTYIYIYVLYYMFNVIINNNKCVLFLEFIAVSAEGMAVYILERNPCIHKWLGFGFDYKRTTAAAKGRDPARGRGEKKRKGNGECSPFGDFSWRGKKGHL